MKSGKGIISPFVEIEITGLDNDKSKFKTTTSKKLLFYFPFVIWFTKVLVWKYM